MGAVILGLVGVALLVGLVRLFVGADPRRLAQVLRWVALGLCGAAAVLLVLTGRGGAALLPLMAAAFLLRRLAVRIPGFGGSFGWHGAGTGGGRPRSDRGSDVRTEWLRMHLDHDTGAMSGTVLRGRFRGTDLDGLDFGQVRDVLAEVNAADTQSGAILETYLDRRFGPEWRERRFDGEAPSAAGPMTEAEARDILGVGAGATTDEIREAHRALMKKLHPDQGGPAWFALKLNAARDLLLRSGSGP